MANKTVLKGGLLLTFGGAAGAFSTFARNIIIARIISVEDFGIAATFGITMALVEMSAGMGVDRLIVQAPDGNNRNLQSTVHLFNFLRGLLLGLILFVVAGPIANLFDLPELIWAFQLLAALPVINGFVHMDPARAQREMRFGPTVWVESGPQVLTVVLAAPLALYFEDYRVMLWLVGAQVISTVLISHLTATRSYRWRWRGEYFRRILSFGWPLLLNGILLFGIFQADRAIVGIAYTIEDLGWFSAAFTLTLFPSMLLARICQTFFMPSLSQSQSDPSQFQAGSIATIKACMLLGVLLSVGLAIAGPSLLILLFGEDYIQGAAILGWLALMQGVRTVKSGPVIVAMSKGETKLPLYANMVRSSALVFALIAIWQGWGILGIVVGGIAGETLAVIWIFILLKWKLKLNLSLIYIFTIVSLVFALSMLALSLHWVTGNHPIEEIGGSILAGIVVLGGSLVFARDLIGWLKNMGKKGSGLSLSEGAGNPETRQ